MNPQKYLVCPKCKKSVDDSLKCPVCEYQYSKARDVFDMVNWQLSNDCQPNWNYSDEKIEEAGKPKVEPEKSNSNTETDWRADYQNRKNAETKAAQKALTEKMHELIGTLTGVVCDLATGLGGNLRELVTFGSKDLEIIATDLDKTVLAYTKNWLKPDNRVSFVATDGRYLSIADNTFDYITSLAAFGNIPDSEKVAKELLRTLKPGGKLIIEGSFIDKDTRSFELAKSVGLDKGMVKEYLTDCLTEAGFTSVETNIVGKAIWAENPYDRIPAAGDMAYYVILQAEKR
ncbi:hypothetical protein FACS1894105_09530 [Clostridia bacterium]|nr:hypothetical protein FACS1894105_09530 [Clostridia bacterium]